jgi:hypothetical protein
MNRIHLPKEFSKISPEFTIKMAGNGWIIDFSGRSGITEDWKSLTVIAPDLNAVLDYITHHSEMPSD